jgi:hypothetical protein
MKNQRTNANKALIIVGLYFLAALIGGWILKRNMVLGAALAKLPVNLLLLVNATFVFSGVPLSAVGDLLLLKKLGISYLYFWPLLVAIASCSQIYFFRSPVCRSWVLPLIESLEKRSQLVSLGKKRQSFLVLLIRSVPLMPFVLGSFVIAMLPQVSHRSIIIFSIIGCYLYYAYFGAGYLLGSS